VEFIEDSYDLSWYRTGVSQATAGRPYGFMPDILGLPARNVGAVFDRPPGSGNILHNSLYLLIIWVDRKGRDIHGYECN
jgi:hypothetical protein